MEVMSYEMAITLLVIIKEKLVDMTDIIRYKDYDEYELQNFNFDAEEQEWWYLTKDEFNLLKAFLDHSYTEKELKKNS